MRARPAPPRSPNGELEPQSDSAVQAAFRPRSTSSPAPRTAMPLLRNRGLPSSDVEAEVRSLLQELSLEPPFDRYATRQRRSTPQEPVTPSAEDTYADVIRTELASARELKDELQMLQAISDMLTLLPAAAPALRNDCFNEICALFRRSAGREPGTQCATTLVRTVARNPTSADRNEAVANAHRTVMLLLESTRHFPFEARNEIAIAGLYAADELDCFAMAKDVIDGLLGGHAGGDPEAAVGRISDVARSLHRMPMLYRTLAAMKLYQYAPPTKPWYLRALEAIAHNNDCLPDTPVTKDFCRSLNQDLYQLRMANE